MTKPKSEFLSLLCNLYIIVLLAALPLYMGEGYWQLGEAKYLLFRNVSLLCLGLWLAAGTPERLRQLGRRQNQRPSLIVGSVTDWFVAAYGVCVVLSALCSAYGSLAWGGYEGWHMGAVSQLLFTGIYFFVSRQYDGSGFPIYVGEGALAVTTLLGLLHRLGVDPLGVLAAYDRGDWEYSHMMSTLGNINWLCGFYSVALAFSMAHFLRERRRPVAAGLYFLNVAVFLLLLIQGSYSGLLIPAACMGACLLTGSKREAARALSVSAGAFFLMPVWERLMILMGENAILAADGNIFAVTAWYVWLLGALGCLLGIWVIRRLSERAVKRMFGCLFLLGIAAFLLAAAVWLRGGGLEDGFGSGRGFLWRISVESFGEAGWKDAALGAGPDCFGEAVFKKDGAGTGVWDGTYWENAVFTNAHSEALTQLLNLGVLGTACYFGIFAAGLYRYRRMPLGTLALSMYGVYALVSFQQVLNAPLLFLALGVCESRMRATQAL